MTEHSCTWCGTHVESDDGWRAGEAAGERRATFCRLEHVFPWWAKGPHWEAGTLREPLHLADSLTAPARDAAWRLCDMALRDGGRLYLEFRSGTAEPRSAMLDAFSASAIRCTMNAGMASLISAATWMQRAGWLRLRSFQAR